MVSRLELWVAVINNRLAILDNREWAAPGARAAALQRMNAMNRLFRLALFAGIAAVLGRNSAGADGTAIRTLSVDAITIKEPGGQARSLDSLLKDVAQYKFGDNRACLFAVERLTLALGASNEAARRSMAARYATLLAGPATADGKRFVCRQLGLIGMAGDVPALEGLLADEEFAFAARSALERIAGDESLAALRRAAGVAKGLSKAGLIESLGVRRDSRAIPLLSAALKDSDHAVVAAALLSLGRIGSDDALSVLKRISQPPDDLWPQWSQALLQIAICSRQDEIERRLSDLALLQSADRPASVRAAALLARMGLLGDKGFGLWFNALAGKDPVLLSTAVRALYLDPKDGRLNELAGKFDGLSQTAQVRVIRALADGRRSAALPIVAKAAVSKDPAVRQAALAALGNVGNASSVPLLVAALPLDDKDVAKQAEEGLVRLRGPGVEAALVDCLRQSPVTTQRKIIRALAARSAKDTVPVLLTLAENHDVEVRSEAIRALGILADASAGWKIIEIFDRATDRAAVEAALVSIYRRGNSIDPLLQAVRHANGPRKVSLIAVLGTLGGPKACDAIRAAIKTQDAVARRAAVRALAAWSDATPLDDLLSEASSTEDATIKAIALRGVANMVPAALDRTPDDRVAILRKAISLADSKEQIKPILAALGKVPCRAAAQFAVRYLNDAALRDEATLAVAEVAEAIGAQARAQVSAELKQARAVCDNAVIKARLNAIPLGENLALGSKATNPDGLAADGQGGPPQAAIDGNPNTYWDEVDNQKLYQLRVEMKKPSAVGLIRILGFRHHEFAPRDFEILCDDKVVKQVHDAQYDNNILTVPVPPTTCTRVELRITGYYGGSPAIRELEIYQPED
jgi:HEAT repeat protein